MRKLLVVGVDMDGHFFVEDIGERRKVFEFLRENYFDSLQESADIKLNVYLEEDVKCEHCRSVIGHNHVRDEDEVKKVEHWLLNMSKRKWEDIVALSTMRGRVEIVEKKF